MSTEFKLPDLGENIEGGDVVSVLIAEGDTIDADTEVIEVETDKAMLPVPCDIGGKVTKIHVGEGDTIKVGQTILTIEASGGGSAAPAATPKAEPAAPPKEEPKQEAAPVVEEPAQPEPAKPSPPPAPTPPVAPAASASPVADSSLGSSASPSTRRLARELGVDLAHVRGSGEGGRITRDDLMAAARNRGGAAPAPAKAPAPTPAKPAAKSEAPAAPTGDAGSDNYGPIITDKLPKIRRTIAVNLAKSASTIPHVTNFDDADVTELERLRQASKEDYLAAGMKLTSMPFLIKAVAMALKRHPKVNASLDMDNGTITYKQYVNVGIAVDSERGLVVPNVRNADTLSIPELTRALADMVDRVRSSKFGLDELRGGTFTISNLGAIGGTYSTPIINPPEVAILLVGRSRKMPVVTEGDNIEARLLMPMSLSYDHRLVDGADAARFLNDVIAFLETPSRLLLTP